MKETLYSFLDSDNILYKHQYVFRQEFSTRLVLIEITEQIKNALYEGNLTVGMYLDLSDNHKINVLLEKIKFMEYEI